MADPQVLHTIDELAGLVRSHGDRRWLFRGMRSEHYVLIPSIGRPESRKDSRTGRPVRYEPEYERRMLDNFKNRVRPFLSHQPQHDLEWLAIAQHHGMMTRLLDWSSSPLIAAFFACEEAPEEREDIAIVGIPEPEPATSGDPFAGDAVRSYRPPHLSPRISAQQSVFTLHPFPDREYSPAELKKWVVPGKLFFNLKNWLDVCGINDASLRPDIEGAAKYVRWQYKWSILPPTLDSARPERESAQPKRRTRRSRRAAR
jgi:hypothetical protein